MPINKPTVLRNGVSGNYWVVERFYVSPNFRDMNATVSFFTSQASYLSGQSALDRRVYDSTDPDCSLNFGALKPLVELGLIANVADFVSGTQVQ